MDNDGIYIEDESGDKAFFTIIPNIVVDAPASATDKALYLLMKRHAGENGGKCFLSDKTMRKKLNIGKIALKKSREFLLFKKWIIFVFMLYSQACDKIRELFKKIINLFFGGPSTQSNTKCSIG